MANIDGMRERTVVVNSLSKTYSVTGWRVGYCIAPPDITSAIRKVHDFLTVGAANPLQHAGTYAMSLPPSYYDELQSEYQRKRDFIVPALKAAGFKCDYPDGAYYVMCDISDFGFANDIEFTCSPSWATGSTLVAVCASIACVMTSSPTRLIN